MTYSYSIHLLLEFLLKPNICQFCNLDTIIHSLAVSLEKY